MAAHRSTLWPAAAGAYSSAAQDLAEANDWPEYALDGALAIVSVTDAYYGEDRPPLHAWLAQLAYLLVEDAPEEDAPGWLALAGAVLTVAEAAESAGAAAEATSWLEEELEDALEAALEAELEEEDIQAESAQVIGRGQEELEESGPGLEDPIGWAQAHPGKAFGLLAAAALVIGLAVNPAGAVTAIKAVFR